LQTDRKPKPNEQQHMHYEKGPMGFQSQSASNLQNDSLFWPRKWRGKLKRPFFEG